ncbi:dihydroorotate dehydrogenase electron transfer subunit [Cellulosilyticum sp. I15G10I2]|uniref:dihydroorotate dehydrogenase electron transfer subunit n=1 Tax=Cellulosilyticum sp. I15G10I2 TaxID=1892843 RepID=UPI00085C254E|nr:dihydroorotate dehydrogenase electron transfer subunit [Cellulosilyticum sp. I15G10I2]
MCKKIVEGRVLQNIEIATDVYRMVIENKEVATLAQCGQFVNLYPDGKHTLLPRPISICEVVRDTITLVYGVVGAGTREFADYKVGKVIKLSTAVGTGFKPQDTELAVLVGGGIGVPPLVELAKQLTCPKVAVIGFRDEPFLKTELEKAGAKVYVATDNGKEGFKGNVIDLIKKEGIQGDYFYSCGPKVMLKALADYCSERAIPIQVSLEERMGCGYGACVGCVCKIKEDNQLGYEHKKVCKDGPVFLGSEVIWHD